MDTRRHGRPLRPRLLSSPEDEATVSDETGACSAARAALQSAAWRTGALCTPLRPGKANTLRDDDGEENRGVRAEPGRLRLFKVRKVPGGVPASLFLRERRPRAPFRMSECLSMKFEGTKHVRTVSLDIKT